MTRRRMYGQKRTGNDYRAERTKRLQQYNPEEKAGKSESDIQCPKGRNSAHQSKAVGRLSYAYYELKIKVMNGRICEC